MHNSENYLEVVPGGIGPQLALMNNTCTGCHTGSNASTPDRPFVFDTASPLPLYDSSAATTHGTLAGGSFYWVMTGLPGSDLKGHNVAGVGATQIFRTPPGGSDTFDATAPLTCAGDKGCHGVIKTGMNQVTSIWGSHHANGTQSIDGSSVARSYRFLNGIVGVEDSDWEYSLAAGDHNQYKGVARTADDDIGANSKTISHFCAECHGDFHSGAYPAGVSNITFATDPWIRHPVDIDMGPVAGAGSEYAAYGGGGGYDVRTPLADDNFLDVTSMLNSVTLGSAGKNAIITCITCHRAHGSPWDYSLRWDYKNWPGTGGYIYKGGCPDCHSAKN
jgi:cytochrome c553